MQYREGREFPVRRSFRVDGKSPHPDNDLLRVFLKPNQFLLARPDMQYREGREFPVRRSFRVDGKSPHPDNDLLRVFLKPNQFLLTRGLSQKLIVVRPF